MTKTYINVYKAFDLCYVISSEGLISRREGYFGSNSEIEYYYVFLGVEPETQSQKNALAEIKD